MLELIIGISRNIYECSIYMSFYREYAIMYSRILLNNIITQAKLYSTEILMLWSVSTKNPFDTIEQVSSPNLRQAFEQQGLEGLLAIVRNLSTFSSLFLSPDIDETNTRQTSDFRVKQQPAK